jgi:hypothetical protein
VCFIFLIVCTIIGCPLKLHFTSTCAKFEGKGWEAGCDPETEPEARAYVVGVGVHLDLVLVICGVREALAPVQAATNCGWDGVCVRRGAHRLVQFP